VPGDAISSAFIVAYWASALPHTKVSRREEKRREEKRREEKRREEFHS
jgi:hypothetical protein